MGTTERAAALLRKLRPEFTFPDTHPEQSDILIAYCPERILPGRTLRELTDNARVLGGLDRRSAVRAKEMYASFAVGPMRLTTARVAELSKLVENAFRNVNVAFANELSLVCDTLGLDVWSVIKIANLHPRVNILSPGPGVGGRCIPIDPWFIHQAAPDRTPLIKAAREVNDGKPHFVADRIIKLAKRFRQPVIGLLGLSYKPNVDDLRESPALEIARKIASRRIGTVLAVEPHLNELPNSWPIIQASNSPTDNGGQAGRHRHSCRTQQIPLTRPRRGGVKDCRRHRWAVGWIGRSGRARGVTVIPEQTRCVSRCLAFRSTSCRTTRRLSASWRRSPNGQRCQHVALNVAKLVNARTDAELDRDVRASDIVGVDGMGIVYALRLLGHRVSQRVAGADLFESLIAECAARGLRPTCSGLPPRCWRRPD